LNGGKATAQAIFTFANAVDPFGYGVAIRVAGLLHTGVDLPLAITDHPMVAMVAEEVMEEWKG